MLTVSLTSIPPRFTGLPAALESLVAQRGVSRVVLTIPHRYARFPDSFTLPKLPQGVTLLRCDDIGPACKILPLAQQSEPTQPILYCDDDWDYQQGWAEGFLAAHIVRPDVAIAASTYDATRIGAAKPTLIAQGFAGVLLTPQLLPKAAYTIPRACRAVDDVWLSGMLALHGTTLKTAPTLRALATPSCNENAPLQAGSARDAANRACIKHLSQQHSLWHCISEKTP
ncbi:hypothetical protein KO498_00375 [Lentibacter algarum]|uniref:hypothetical protein n=1 Tax=Lentibacter algarum TaxID=576131 RepID=UPI001C077FC4|nr:hypothetical protein [Lentibacter algarum]MBU2980253.1 hypothetical protein [Lentibacter algarum]